VGILKPMRKTRPMYLSNTSDQVIMQATHKDHLKGGISNTGVWLHTLTPSSDHLVRALGIDKINNQLCPWRISSAQAPCLMWPTQICCLLGYSKPRISSVPWTTSEFSHHSTKTALWLGLLLGSYLTTCSDSASVSALCPDLQQGLLGFLSFL
jgi:hypothetical protein